MLIDVAVARGELGFLHPPVLGFEMHAQVRIDLLQKGDPVFRAVRIRTLQQLVELGMDTVHGAVSEIGNLRRWRRGIRTALEIHGNR